MPLIILLIVLLVLPGTAGGEAGTKTFEVEWTPPSGADDSDVIFYAAGRHPLAGIAAAFAGVSGGFSANLIPSGIDPLLQGFTQTAAQIGLQPRFEDWKLINAQALVNGAVSARILPFPSVTMEDVTVGTGFDPSIQYRKPGYGIQDVFATWLPMGADKLRVTLGVYNLFDQNYYDQGTYSYHPVFARNIGYAAPGRDVRLSLNWKF